MSTAGNYKYILLGRCSAFQLTEDCVREAYIHSKKRNKKLTFAYKMIYVSPQRPRPVFRQCVARQGQTSFRHNYLSGRLRVNAECN